VTFGFEAIFSDLCFCRCKTAAVNPRNKFSYEHFNLSVDWLSIPQRSSTLLRTI